MLKLVAEAHYLATRPEVAFHLEATRWIGLSEGDVHSGAAGALFLATLSEIAFHQSLNHQFANSVNNYRGNRFPVPK